MVMKSNLGKARMGALGASWVTKWRDKAPGLDPASAPPPARSIARAGAAANKKPAAKTKTA
jgi:hypothetical protein